ncbi:aldose epimerase [Aquibacillus sediminis]|uniref:aldose epimerase family protein n=1 Tax=Aquibacillus sediminis TaxID=2574734 RepID=UPI001108A943|nr:aldose epimerase [Aquibacillus sediminis]
MYKMESYEEQSFTMYQLSNADESTWITVCPERGGIITEFGVEGKQQLYLNKETLFDRKQNVRGGIPILFPISGQLKHGQYEWEGKTYEMPNHGLARITPWEVVESTCDEEQASITIRFASSIGTKSVFPFDFEVLFTYTVKGNRLLIDQSYYNASEKAMPIYPGFHPYFYTESKKVTLQTDATKYIDYNDGEVRDFTGEIDMENMIEAVALLDAEDKQLTAQMDPSKEIKIKTEQEFNYTVLWTEQGKDFVCIEPWTALTGELNRKQELLMIEPKQTLDTGVIFQVVYK